MSDSFIMNSGRIGRIRTSASATPSIISGDHVFEIPAKLIRLPADMKIWEKSEAYFEYLGFILAINEAIRGRSNSQGSAHLSEAVVRMVGLLDKLDALVDETPPVQQPQRFGNVAFRTWYQKVKDSTLGLLQEVIRPELNKAIPEVASYLMDGFGNATRIDYGTGHEISFIMFLCCLFKIGLFKEFDKMATGCHIFPRYLDLARKLQKTYRMEPAGSHGVWSLDDYQFVPFIWGSSQLVGHPIIEPNLFLNPPILSEYGEDYMFLTCIQYINSVKSGPFAEHSNQLWSISGVSSWSKINGGLIKMYKAEVLSKFPVIQHIVFGSLFTLKPMEECMGMMTPKYEMVPPPNPPSVSSSSSESLKSFEKADQTSSDSASYRKPASETKEPSLNSSRSSKSRESSKKSERLTPHDASSEQSDFVTPTGSDNVFAAIREMEMARRTRRASDDNAASEREGTESVRFSTKDDESAHRGRRGMKMPMEGRFGFDK